MNTVQLKPNTDRILNGLKDFQRVTVDYVYHRLYEDNDQVKRFLIADEVGLGKTLVAKGVIAKVVDKLWDKPNHRIDIVYICASQDIARQNIARLNIIDERNMAVPSRLTLLPLHLKEFKKRQLNFVSFTPGTSFDLRSRGGVMYERALIYHLMCQAWNLGSVAGPKNLLQIDVKRENWHYQLDTFLSKPENKINRELAQLYIQALRKDKHLYQRFSDLVSRFNRHRKHIPREDRQEQLALVGDLRHLLARSCLSALEPDIVILDEFQRFKYLLEGDDEVAQLARDLFTFPDVRTLLLSATPYKMYTMHHESAEDDHYADLLRTVRFLFDSEDQTGAFKQELQSYREELFRFGNNGTSGLAQAKDAIEARLRQVMVRTERLSITTNRDAMLESHVHPGSLTAQDLRAFALFDGVAQQLQTGDTVEYWKSAPYLLNLMEKSGYKIKREFINQLDAQNSKLLPLFQAGQSTLLDWTAIQAYQTIDSGNAKLRTLMAQTVKRGAWKLLWIPPSLPYYQLTSGPFSDPELKDFTKALVFSSWQIVPKVIAMLCSYEAERSMVTAFDKETTYQEERRKRRPLLRFAFTKLADGESRYTGMSNFTLLYPCLTLATRLDPLNLCLDLTQSKDLPLIEEVIKTATKHIELLMTPILQRYASSKGRVDERWYWAAPALLDRYHHSGLVSNWFEDENEETAWRFMVENQTEEEVDTNFAEHVDLFYQRFKDTSQLGVPPDDLFEVMAKMALASPAIVTLRAFLRFSSKTDWGATVAPALTAAAKVALGFRSLFNMPDSTTLIRYLHAGDDTRYWESVLDYGVNGNLQAVIDEYLHILRDVLGLVDKSLDIAAPTIAEELHKAVSLRTVRLNFDEIEVQPKVRISDAFTYLRCRFALRFGNDEAEDGSETRLDQVRNAFNSPFRPFILATTSIGQEGLDFHQYCHEIYHWNLPSNPVDLEQREGRIHRYKGHVIRRNVVRAFPISTLMGRGEMLADPWQTLFELAQAARQQEHNDLVPFWIFEPNEGQAGCKIKRHILALPLSRDRDRLTSLLRTLVAYRMVFGQPRQEDLINYLQIHLGSDFNLDELLQYRIDLSPISWWQRDK